MSGTDFPTDDNWLLCSGCSRYFAERDISTEDQNHQWCIECHRDWATKLSANSGVEGCDE